MLVSNSVSNCCWSQSLVLGNYFTKTIAIRLHSQRFKLAVQLPYKTSKANFGTYNYGTIVKIGPNRRYFIKTKSGWILVCNRHFLRRCTPASLQPPSPSQDSSTAFHTSLPVQPSPLSQAQDEVHRSNHTRKPPARLVEDSTWPKWCQHCVSCATNAWEEV